MSFFDDPTIAALASSEYVSAVAMFKMELASETLYFAEGTAGFEDTNGQLWGGMDSGIVSYDDINYSLGVVANKRTYTLNAGELGGLAMSIVGQEEEYRWRRISQFIQFFLPDGSLAGSPLLLHTGLMDRLSFSLDPSGRAELKLTTETEFARKNSSPYGFYNDTDQKARFPNDDGFERVPLLAAGEVVRWPDF